MRCARGRPNPEAAPPALRAAHPARDRLAARQFRGPAELGDRLGRCRLEGHDHRPHAQPRVLAEPGTKGLDVAGQGIGTLVLHAFERSERVYATMLLRGHSGRVCGCRHWAELSRADVWVGAIAAATLYVHCQHNVGA